MKFLVVICLLLSVPAFAGSDSSSFIDAVKSLRPLGATYRALEQDLLNQGYSPSASAEVSHESSNQAGVELFTIKQSFMRASCATCGVYVIHVTGKKRNDPPPPGEKDIFQVDSVLVSQH